MRSECQFFMRPEDERVFLEFATGDLNLRFAGSGSIASLESDFGSIQFLRSEQFGMTLTSGRIAIATTGFSLEYDSVNAPKLEKAYSTLRRWVQARYSNKLVCYSEYFPEGQRVTNKTRVFWLGPHEKGWLQTEPTSELRQFHTGAVVFKIEGQQATA